MTKKSHSPSAIFELGFKEPYLRAADKPFVKLLNWYTGFGKTYTAASFSIELFVKCDVIPVFIAPLQSLVTGFSSNLGAQLNQGEYAEDIEAALKSRGVSIPVHRLYSREYHNNDKTFFRACLALAAWLEANPQIASKMDTSVKTAGTKSGVRARLADLRSKAAYCEGSNFLGMANSVDGFEETKDAYMKAASKVYGIADAFTWRLICLDVASRPAGRREDRFLEVSQVAEMVRRLHPLQAFLDNPGVIVSTASKAQAGHRVFAPDESGEVGQRKFDNLPLFLEELNRDGSFLGRMVSRRPDSARVVTFVDEEEDAYWYLFDQRKSVVNFGGKNDLCWVISEFFKYFDLSWPMAFDILQGRDAPVWTGLSTKVYNHLEHFAAVSQAVADEFVLEETRTAAKYISDERRVEILKDKLRGVKAEGVLAAFSDPELLQVLNQLHERMDAHNGFKRFREKARALTLVREYVRKRIPKGAHGYEAFRDLYELVVGKKFFTMSRATYGEVVDQPGQTFFTESANVMDTEFLRRIELVKDTADSTIRLIYHDGGPAGGAYTLLDYLQLVVLMARVLAATSGGNVIEMSDEDSKVRYKHLHTFRNDVRRLFDGRVTEEGLLEESSDKELLTDFFLFEGTKSVVTLEECDTQAEEYNLAADVSLTLTITSLKATPEEDIVRALGRTNGVYLMSATGGLEAASSGAFNVRHLRRALEARGGHFSDMSQAELDVVAAHSAESLKQRERITKILDDTQPAVGFATSQSYRGLAEMFRDALPKKDDKAGYVPLIVHKKRELDGLVATLDKLLSTPIRSGLVLCQTTRHIQKCLKRLANSSEFGFVVQKDTTGDHFEINPSRLPGYRQFGVKEPVTIILYSAARFRRKDRSKTGAVEEADDEGQFSQELEQALDITNRKLLLWTSYKSASRGINFLTKTKEDLRVVSRDFELFSLLNDPYYTRHTRPGESGFSMEMFQAFAQVLRDENEDWASMSKGDLLYEYARNRYRRLRKEHVIDIARTVFQAIGRGERSREHVATQHIFVSSEAARMVHLGLRHVPELGERASPAQQALMAAIRTHNQVSSLFTTEEERQFRHKEDLKLARSFRTFTSETPLRFRSDAQARWAWDKLFDALMFTDPVKYLAKLEEAGIPEAFRRGCYADVPASAELYCRQFAIAANSEMVITDAADGDDAYSWTDLTVPESLVGQLSPSTRALLKETRGFKVGDGTRRLVPQPWFVKEIMKGYVAELEFEQYIGAQFNVWAKKLPLPVGAVSYLQPADHPLYADIYQVFDYYLVPRPGVLVAVDLKNWARTSDSLNKDRLQESAREKHERLRELFPDATVHAVYVNLVGAFKFPMEKAASGTIRFMSLFVRGAGDSGYITNSNLRDAILAK